MVLCAEQKWLHRREEDYKAVCASSELKLIADRCYHVRTAPISKNEQTKERGEESSGSEERKG